MASSFQSCALNLASKPAGSLPLSLSYFAHRYSIFCELLLGTAIRLHTKGKTRLDSRGYQDGFLLGKFQYDSATNQRCKQNNTDFIFCQKLFLKKSFDEIYISHHSSHIGGELYVNSNSVVV